MAAIDAARVRRGELYLLLGALTAFAPLTTDIYVPAMPTLQRAFATTNENVQLTLSAYFIGFALGQAFYGPITDRWGRKPPLYFGQALYVLASLACSLAPSIHWVMLARFVQAIGACSGIVIGRAIVSDLFATQEAARVFGMLTMVMGAAPILAPSIGAYLMVWFGWQMIFYLLAALGALAMLMVWLRLPETRNATASSPIALIHVLRRYGEIGRDRRFLAFCLPGAFGMAGMYAYIAGSSFVFIDGYGFGPQAYGILFGSNSLALILSAQVNRFLLRQHKAEVMLRRILIVEAGVGLVLLAVALSHPANPLVIAVPLFCFMATLGYVWPNAMALAMGSFRHQAGFASALLGASQSTLASCTAILVGAIGGSSAVPMALIMAIYATLAVVTSRLIKPSAPAAHPL